MEAASIEFKSKAKQLFGHPRGLSFLFATEMWERFSYYGMRALLILYLTKYLLLPGHSEQVIGLATLKSGLEGVFGPLETQPFASQIYGLYTAFVYLTPVLGGLLADRVLGQRRTVVIGAALMALGHFLMAFENLLLIALSTLIVANGAVQAEHIHPGRRPLCGRRPPARPRLLHLLCRHQCRRVPGAAHLRHARRGVGLALRLWRGGRRHADRAGNLPVRAPRAAAR